MRATNYKKEKEVLEKQMVTSHPFFQNILFCKINTLKFRTEQNLEAFIFEYFFLTHYENSTYP